MYYEKSGGFGARVNPDMDRIGLVKDVFPGMDTWEQMVMRSGITLEIWTQTNPTEDAIDLFLRVVLLDIPTAHSYAHWEVHGAGTNPKNWYYGVSMQYRGIYDCGGTTHVQRPSRM